jgi:hypothetical protein
VSITGLSTTATGTVLTLTDSASTSTVNLIIDNQKEIRFRETTANGTNYVALKAPASVSADLTFTLPATDGTANQVLTTSGAGVLSFTNAPTGFRNRIINGDMIVSQRNGTSSVTAVNNAYCLDRFQIYSGASSKFSVQQVSDAPTGFAFSLKATSSSAYSVGVSESFSINQFIEGFNTADLAFGTASAKTVTLSFWVKSSLTGTFGGALNNSGYGRSYPFTYTISTANTWEQKIVTVVGDTSGTWVGATNGIGLIVSFGIGNGSSVSGTANSWASALYTNATGATSVVGTSGATWQITGVQLEAGTSATDFEFLPIDVSLGRCQRYYYRIPSGTAGQVFASGFVSTTSTARFFFLFPVQLRAAASALEQSGTAGDYRVNNLAVATGCSSVPTFDTSTANTVIIIFTTAATLTAGNACIASCTNTSAFLAFTAEL